MVGGRVPQVTSFTGINSPAVDTAPLSTSGTSGYTRFNTMRLIEHAVRRCKLPAEALGSELIETAKGCLFLLLSHLSNKGLPLWTIERDLLGLYPNRRQAYLPLGTVDVPNSNYRTFLNRYSGTVTAPASTTTPQAIVDGLLAGSSVQPSPNGYFSINWGSATPVTTLGINSFGDNWYDLNLDYSSDGVSWTTILNLPQTQYLDGVWSYVDIDGAPNAQYWRIIETGGATLSLRQMIMANTPSSIPLAKLNRDQYTQLVNPMFASGRSLQYWFDKQALQPIMVLWPVPTDPMASLEVYRARHIQDVGMLTDQIEAPQKWLQAITWMEADAIACEDPRVDPQWATVVAGKAKEHELQAWGRESDGAPVEFAPNISAYTR